MDAFNVFTRLMLATLCVLGAVRQSESITFRSKPEDPKIVVLGVTSNQVSLKWDFSADSGETIQSVIFERQRPGKTEQTQIASRGPNEGFSMLDPFKDSKKYKAVLDSELKLYNVQRDEEYVYTLTINYKTSGGLFLSPSYQVLVDVKVPPKITVSPTREPELNRGQNYTLKCNASGDPHPNITWTKDGIKENEFNASGYLLHLVNVQRKDAGSYRCIASNGYGNDATAVSIVAIKCSASSCKRVVVGIRLSDEQWKSAYSNQASVEFKTLESKLLSEVSRVYAKKSEIPIYRMVVDNFRSGSVFATIELTFGNSQDDTNLKPLKDEMADKKLGQFAVDPELVIDPTTPPPTSPTEQTTTETQEPPDTGARESGGLTNSEMWGIIGGCIAFVLLIVIIILICCICKKRKNSGGASKGGKSYSEADGYRMNRQQPPPSGLGTASPAYVEARQYAPVTAARKQDDQSKPPLNYADLSFNNSSAPGRQPPRYSGTEYSEMSPEKRPPPAGGQQGEGGGFELWC